MYFEPKRLTIGQIDKAILRLRSVYKENPEYFEVPNFAIKVY